MTAVDCAILVQRLAIGGDGPRVVVKDCLDIAGYVTGLGSRAFADAQPAHVNADVVAALISAGTHIVGKASMHELAYGVTGINGWNGTPVNPYYPKRVPGGSSSGSAAAVAAGIVDFAIGTDTGGSIRVPATCCGIAGFKPTFGRVSRNGAHPASSSLDCIGPLARDVATLEQAMTIIDATFTIEERPSNIVLGVVEVDADPDVRRALESALRSSRMPTVPVCLPSFIDAFHAGIFLMAAEMAPLFGHLCGTGQLGPDVDARLQAAGQISVEQIESAEKIRERFRAEVDGALATVDALVLPSMPSVPPLIEEANDAPRTLCMTNLARPFNVSGHPAISLPLQTDQGLPTGLQLIGARNADAALCALAAVIEQML
jgi:amidase